MAQKVFCCYARKDLDHLVELQKHLTPLRHEGLIAVCSDQDITAGEEWEKEIIANLDTAQVILLLISPDFMASDYGYGTEMKRALDRHQHKEVLVVPIILRPTLWQQSPFSQLQVLPTDGRPVTSPDWPSQDAAFLDIAQGIRKTMSKWFPSSPATQKKASSPRVKVSPDLALSTTDRLFGWFPPKSDALVLIDQVEVPGPGGKDGPATMVIPGNRIAIWKIFTNQSLATFTTSQIKRTCDRVWSPDGSRIALIGERDQHERYRYTGSYSLEVWEPETGSRSLYTPSQIKQITQVIWSPDGSRIVLTGMHDDRYGGGRLSLEVWEPETESSSLVCAYNFHNDVYVSSNVAWSPSSQQIAFITNRNMLRIWDWASRSFIVNITLLENEPDALAWSPKGDYLLLASSRMIQIRNAQSGLISYSDEQQHHPLTWWPSDDLKKYPYALQWLDDSRFAITTRGSIWVKDISTGDTIWEQSFTGWQYAWSNDHSSIAVLEGQGKEVNVYDLETRQCTNAYREDSPDVSIDYLAWSPDNSYLALGCGNGSVLIWNRRTEQISLIYRAHSKRVNSIAWSPDNRYITSVAYTNTYRATESTIHVWASQTTEPTVTEPVELQLVLPTPERIPEPEMQFNIPNSDWHNQDNTFLDVTEDICKADIAEHTNTDPPALPLARNAILIKLVQLGRKFFSRPRKAKTKRIVTNFSGLWLLILIIRIGVCTLSGEFLGGTLFHRALVGLLVGFFFGLYITFLM